VRLKPQVRLSGRNPNGPSDVTDFLMGVTQASAVVWPALDSDTHSDLWDPQLTVTPPT
jgi:hypothetical protein